MDYTILTAEQLEAIQANGVYLTELDLTEMPAEEVGDQGDVDSTE